MKHLDELHQLLLIDLARINVNKEYVSTQLIHSIAVYQHIFYMGNPQMTLYSFHKYYEPLGHRDSLLLFSPAISSGAVSSFRVHILYIKSRLLVKIQQILSNMIWQVPPKNWEGGPHMIGVRVALQFALVQ
jgi:hypothetical protein